MNNQNILEAATHNEKLLQGVQGTRKPGFMERIFVYYYRIFEKYREQGAEIISLAILTDEDEN